MSFKLASIMKRIAVQETSAIADCVECMACSDNTIRAGLTPKFKVYGRGEKSIDWLRTESYRIPLISGREHTVRQHGLHDERAADSR